MAYRGKYPTKIVGFSGISLFNGLYMLTTNDGAKFTVTGAALNHGPSYMGADISAFPDAKRLADTSATRDETTYKALTVTLTYEDGEVLTETALPASGSALGKLAQKFRSFPAPSVRARIVAHVAKHPFSVCMASPAEIAFLKSNGFDL